MERKVKKNIIFILINTYENLYIFKYMLITQASIFQLQLNLIELF